MKYDFTSIIDRRGIDSIAVDLIPSFGPEAPKDGFDIIPMWVADINFPTVPTIQEAIIERAKHPMFGYNKYLRDRVRAQSSKPHYNEVNVLSIHALIGAYKREGHEWVDELCQVLADNNDYACEHIIKNYKGIKFFKPQGTYMLFLDCEQWCKDHNMTIDDLYKAGTDVGVVWQDGRPFNHPYAIRLNLALPKSRLIEAFERLDKYVFKVGQWGRI